MKAPEQSPAMSRSYLTPGTDRQTAKENSSIELATQTLAARHEFKYPLKRVAGLQLDRKVLP